MSNQQMEWAVDGLHMTGVTQALSWRIEVVRAKTTHFVGGEWAQDWTWHVHVQPTGLASGDRSWDVDVKRIAGGQEQAKTEALRALDRIIATIASLTALPAGAAKPASPHGLVGPSGNHDAQHPKVDARRDPNGDAMTTADQKSPEQTEADALLIALRQFDWGKGAGVIGLAAAIRAVARDEAQRALADMARSIASQGSK